MVIASDLLVGREDLLARGTFYQITVVVKRTFVEK